MSSPAFGALYGGYKYESPEARALGSINTGSYDYRDQGKFMSKIAGDVSYMAAYMRKMQKGIDDANQNIIQQIQSLIEEIIVLFGGGGDTGFDFGDLKYIFQAFGAFFGFQPGMQLPINLFGAAWHFFFNYIVPLQDFKELFDTLIDASIATMLDMFGEVPIVGQAVQQLAVLLSTFRDQVDPWLDLLGSMSEALGNPNVDPTLWNAFWNNFAPVWDFLYGIFQPFLGPTQGTTANIFSTIGSTWASIDIFGTPLVNVIPNAVNFVANTIENLDLSNKTIQEIGYFWSNLMTFLGDPVLAIAEFDPNGPWGDIMQNYLSPVFTRAQFIVDLVGSVLGSGVSGLGTGNVSLPSNINDVPILGLVIQWIKETLIDPILGGTTNTISDFQSWLEGKLQNLSPQGILSLVGLGTGTIPAGVIVPGQQLSGVVNSTVIPALDATKIVTGQFAASLIPNLNASIINAGTFVSSLIPSLDASKIITGELLPSLIPNLDAAKIVSGNLNDAITIGEQTLYSLQQNANDAINQIGDATNAIALDVGAAANGFANALSGWLGGFATAWGGGGSVPAVAVTNAAESNKTVVSSTSQSVIDIKNLLPNMYGATALGSATNSVIFENNTLSGCTEFPTFIRASARLDSPAETDSQTAAAIFVVQDGPAKYLIIRANAFFTTFTYAKIQSNDPITNAGNCEIGCVVNGTKTVLSTPGQFVIPGNGLVTTAAEYSFTGIERAFKISGPGFAFAFTESGTTSQIGESYRYGGFGTDGWVRQTDTIIEVTDYVPPVWADELDMLVYGGGGGGAGGITYGFTGNTGGPGGGGQVSTHTFISGDIPSLISVTPGAGGGGGATGGAYAFAGGSGATTAVQYAPDTVMLIPGGGGGQPVGPPNPGGSPTDVVVRNTLYPGGPGGGFASGSGGAPGGGGAGGTWWSTGASAGGSGAKGGAVIAAIDMSVPGQFGYFSFFDVAISGPKSASVNTNETTGSATYTNLTTYGPEVTVNVGPSGMVLLCFDAQMHGNTAAGPMNYMSVQMSGANIRAANDDLSISYQTTNGSTQGAGVQRLLTELNPGPTTFTAKYRITGYSCNFRYRNLAAIPL